MEEERTLQEQCYGTCWAACERIQELEIVINDLKIKNQQLEQELDGLENPCYCPTCGSCGEEGCCSPGKCEKVKCLYGDRAIAQYEEMQKDYDELSEKYSILIDHNKGDDPFDMKEAQDFPRTSYVVPLAQARFWFNETKRRIGENLSEFRRVWNSALQDKHINYSDHGHTVHERIKRETEHLQEELFKLQKQQDEINSSGNGYYSMTDLIEKEVKNKPCCGGNCGCK